MSNVSMFVDSKINGELAVAMFGIGARLDYREHEPNWIQVKVSVCADHVDALKALLALLPEARLTIAKIEAVRDRFA